MQTPQEQESLFASAIKSLYSFGAYARLRAHSTGKAMLFLLLLSLICGLISSVHIYREMDGAFREMRQKFISEFPDFIFTKEGFRVQGKVPVIYAEEDKTVLVFDPTGKAGVRVLDTYEKGVYISNKVILYKKSSVETREYTMDSLRELAPFTKQDVDTFLAYHWVLSVFIIFFYLVYYVIAKYFSAFIIALLGLIVKSVAKYELSFDELFRLGIYTLTLPIIIKTAASAAKMDIPYFFLIYYGIALFYLYMGISAIKTSAPESQNPKE